MEKKRIAILISGRGSNMQALLDACAHAEFPARCALVLSNRPNAAGLALASERGVDTHVIDHKEFEKTDQGRAEFDAAIDARLTECGVQLVCLAGFMRLLTDQFVMKWRGRMLNIHPSLLPAFKGLNVHERMLTAGVKIAGCTVHFVTPDMDSGPIVGQAALPVANGETPETLAARILSLEHQLYPRCLELLASGRARLGAGDVVQLPGDGDAAERSLMQPANIA